MLGGNSPISKTSDISLSIIKQREENIEVNRENQKLAQKYEELLVLNRKLGEDISIVDDEQRKLEQKRNKMLLKLSNLKRERKVLSGTVHEKASKITEDPEFASVSRELFVARDEKRDILQYVHNLFLYHKDYDFLKQSVSKTQKINEIMYREQKQLEHEIDVLRRITEESIDIDKHTEINQITSQIDKRNSVLSKILDEDKNINKLLVKKIMKSIYKSALQPNLSLEEEEEDIDYNDEDDSSEVFTFENSPVPSPIKLTSQSGVQSKVSFIFESDQIPLTKSESQQSYESTESLSEGKPEFTLSSIFHYSALKIANQLKTLDDKSTQVNERELLPFPVINTKPVLPETEAVTQQHEEKITERKIRFSTPKILSFSTVCGADVGPTSDPVKDNITPLIRHTDESSQTLISGADYDFHEKYSREQDENLKQYKNVKDEYLKQKEIVDKLTAEYNKYKEREQNMDREIEFTKSTLQQITDTVEYDRTYESNQKALYEEAFRNAKRLKALLKQRENIYNAIEDRIDDLDSQYNVLKKNNRRLESELEDFNFIEQSTAGEISKMMYKYQRKTHEMKKKMNVYKQQNVEMKERIDEINNSEKANEVKQLEDLVFQLERKNYKWLLMLTDTSNALQVIEAYSYNATNRRKTILAGFQKAEEKRRIKEDETSQLEIYSKLLSSLIKENKLNWSD